jgi:hypothetical protein
LIRRGLTAILGVAGGCSKKIHQLSWRNLLNHPLLFGTQLQHPLDLRSSKMIRNGQLPPGNGGGVQRLLEVAEFHVPEVTCNNFNFNFNCLPPLEEKKQLNIKPGTLACESRESEIEIEIPPLPEGARASSTYDPLIDRCIF